MTEEPSTSDSVRSAHGTTGATLRDMTRDPDFARNTFAVAALYFGWTSMYALDPIGGPAAAIAIMFALIGLWFALAACFDELALPCDAVHV